MGFHAWDAETYTIKIVDTNRDNTWEDNLEDNINNSYTTYTFDKIYIDTNYEITVWGFNGSKILMTQTLYFRMNDHMGIEKIEQDEFIESGTIFNLQGQIIGRFTENHRDIFTELQPGIYIINGLTSTGKKSTVKLSSKALPPRYDIEKLSCPGINLIKNRTFHISKKELPLPIENKNRVSALSSDIRLSPRSTRQTRKGKR